MLIGVRFLAPEAGTQQSKTDVRKNKPNNKKINENEIIIKKIKLNKDWKRGKEKKIQERETERKK